MKHVEKTSFHRLTITIENITARDLCGIVESLLDKELYEQSRDRVISVSVTPL